MSQYDLLNACLFAVIYGAGFGFAWSVFEYALRRK